MPKITIEYSEEEKHDAETAMRSGDLYLCLTDIHDHIRNKIKYSELSGKELKAYENIQEMFFESVDSYGLNRLLFE